jgi:hypothetical protein
VVCLFSGDPGCCQNEIRMGPHGIVRIHILELDDSIAGHQKNRRDGKQMVVLSGRCFQVDAMLSQRTERALVGFISDTKGLAHLHGAVRKQVEPDIELLNRLLNPGRLVRRDSDDVKTELIELRCNVAQLTQLPPAMRSPASAIEDQQRGPALDGSVQVKRLAGG